MSYLNLRVLLSIIGFLGAIFAPPWVPLLVMAFLAMRYPAWEALVLGFIVDMLWLPSGFFGSIPLFTIAAFVLVWGLEPLRKELLVS